METLIAVAGTLLGAIVGVVGSYLVQRSSYRNESEERLGVLRREAYLDFMFRVHEMFVQIDVVHHEFQHKSLSDAEARQKLGEISPAEAQTSLEALRLLASDGVAERAADLWRHLRRHRSPLGDLTRANYVAWRNSYWTGRRQIIDAARLDLGFKALNWSTAGVDVRATRGVQPGSTPVE